MTEDGIREIEVTLGVRMPPDYRQVMAGGDARVDAGFWRDGLFNLPETVIERSRWLRGLVDDAGAMMPQSCVVVSEVNGGDSVVVDTKEAGSPLRLWNHESLTFEPFVDSLTAFAEACRRAAESS